MKINLKKVGIISISMFLLLSAYGFHSTSITDQIALLSDLLQVSSVVFAILGIWVAVLDPTTFLLKIPSEDTNSKTRLALRFIPLLIVSTIVLILSVLLKFLSVPLISLLSAPGSFIPIIRSIYGFIISSLFIMEIWVILGTLMPIAKVMNKKKNDEVKNKNR